MVGATSLVDDLPNHVSPYSYNGTYKSCLERNHEDSYYSDYKDAPEEEPEQDYPEEEPEEAQTEVEDDQQFENTSQVLSYF